MRLLRLRLLHGCRPISSMSFLSMLKKSALAFCALAGLSTAPALAQSIEGILERGTTHSALFVASPESGDLIGYAFRNDSAVGRSILAECMTELPCAIGQASERPLNAPPANQFKDEPSGWMEITRARDIRMGVDSAYLEEADTRFGRVSVDEEARLRFKGRVVQPEVEGNFSLKIVRMYEAGSSDVLLIKNTGGSGCPALFRFATVTSRGITVTPEFGTCSEIFEAYPSQAQVRVVMPKLVSGNMANGVTGGRKQTWVKTAFVFAQGKVVESR